MSLPDFNKEIEKHKFLIKMNQKNLEGKIKVVDMNPEHQRQYVKDLKRVSKGAPLHIKHSQFMIKILQGILEVDLNKINISINCMKQNACDIEQMMAEQVKDGEYTEQEYIEHMGRFRDEINLWEAFRSRYDL